MAAILNFRIFRKSVKHKIASILHGVRVISSKFSTPRAFKQHNLPKFQKTFVFQKMAAILNVRTNAKTYNCFYFLNRLR